MAEPGRTRLSLTGTPHYPLRWPLSAPHLPGLTRIAAGKNCYPQLFNSPR